MFGDLSVANLKRKMLNIRLLPNLAKHVVLTMLYNQEPVSIVDFDAWLATDSASKSYSIFVSC